MKRGVNVGVPDEGDKWHTCLLLRAGPAFSSVLVKLASSWALRLLGAFLQFMSQRVRDNSFRVYHLHSGKEQTRNRIRTYSHTFYIQANKHTTCFLPTSLQ
jgi:hypothetical protein